MKRATSTFKNGHGGSRFIPLIAGSALVTLGLTRRSKSGIAMAATGGFLALAGTIATNSRREFFAQSSMAVNCSPEEAYRFWRNFENLPLFMRHLESVTIRDQDRSRWTALGPMGIRIQWEAEMVSDQPNSSICWRSLARSDLELEGSVEFHRLPGDRGTLIRAAMKYCPPAGTLGHAIARLVGKDPNFLMRQDLRRFKALIEAGEIPTIEGQTHGPRTALTAALRVMDPGQPWHAGARISEVLAAKRRLA